MSTNITLKITAVPSGDQSQEEADAKLAEVFTKYPSEAIAETLSSDIWSNTDAGWIGLKVEILGDGGTEVATS